MTKQFVYLSEIISAYNETWDTEMTASDLQFQIQESRLWMCNACSQPE